MEYLHDKDLEIMNIVGFMGNLDFAEEFFTRCQKLNPDTRENRVKLLEEMVKELKAIRMNEKDIKRQTKGKKVIVIKKKDNK